MMLCQSYYVVYKIREPPLPKETIGNYLLIIPIRLSFGMMFL